MAVAEQDDISDIELSKFFLSWDCFAKEQNKLKEVCTGLDDQSIFALARHGLICIEKKVGSNQICISDEDAAENETILNENLKIEKLLSACSKVDPSVFVLALQGFCDIVDESDELYHEWFSVPLTYKTAVRQLRKWRCESPFQYQYKKEETFMRERVIPILKSLTIFKTFGVPLFTDNYGNKEVLRNHVTEDIDIIDKDTPIYHVTHKAEAEKIFEEKCLKPSGNKNIIAGTWFGIDDGPSVYGSRAFKTTLGKLGVQVLRQGEIVSYKQEVNVILYAGKKPDLRRWDGKLKAKGLKKPVASEGNYVKISIFVPSEFLPTNTDDFDDVFDGPFEVDHSSFCVREKRSFGKSKCPDNL